MGKSNGPTSKDYFSKISTILFMRLLLKYILPFILS